MIPTSPSGPLNEPSFADAIAMFTTAAELPEHKRCHWATSLRQIAKALGRPLEVIPARYSAVRADLGQLHQVPAGLTAKTLQNHKSNTKSALLWLAREKGIPRYGTPLTAAWERLRSRIPDELLRARLSSFMRFCSADNIAPAEVNETILDRFITYRTGSGMSADTAFRRLVARAWNANVGSVQQWPNVVLVEPPAKAAVELAWECFPAGLRHDVERYLEGLGKVRRSRTGQRIRPLKPSTIRTRRAELAAAGRMAVKAGVPVNELTSLGALLSPEVAERILDAYWRQNGERPTQFTIELACRFNCIYKLRRAAELLAPAIDFSWLAEIEKDLALVMEPRSKLDRLVLTRRLVEAGLTLIVEAQSVASDGLTRARGVRNGLMVALLAMSPIRLKNFADLELGTTFKSVHGRWWITLPEAATKSHRLDERPVSLWLNEYVDTYLSHSRPLLLSPSKPTNALWISSTTGGPLTRKNLGVLISQITRQTLGVAVSPHLFRTAAATTAAAYAGQTPHLASAILNHTDPRVTEQHYNRASSIGAADVYASIVDAYLQM